jgi:hypothetical protein
MIVILQKRLMPMAHAAGNFHMRCGLVATTSENRNTMKDFLKLAGVPAAAMIAAVAYGAINMPEAKAGEFCRRDVTGFMTGCGFDNMEQCQAASAGLGGDCFRDPFLKEHNAQSKNNQSNNALAYQPKSPRLRHASPTAGKAANTSQ